MKKLRREFGTSAPARNPEEEYRESPHTGDLNAIPPGPYHTLFANGLLALRQSYMGRFRRWWLFWEFSGGGRERDLQGYNWKM